MKTIKAKWLMLGLVAAGIPAFSGCGPVDGIEELGSQEQGLDSAGTAQLTLFAEAGLWGDSYTIPLTPLSSLQTSLAIPSYSLAAKNLERRVSSARLRCGDRDASVIVYDGPNATSALSAWTGNVHVFSCAAGQTREVNFHQIQGQPALGSMGDRVSSAFFLVHAKPYGSLPLSTLLANQWDSALSEMLQGKGKKRGEVQLGWKGPTGFRISQGLRVKIDYWPDYDASFSYELVVSASLPDGKPRFRVTGQKVWVESGAFHDRVYNRLQGYVTDGAQKLVSQLNEGLGFLGGKGSYYLLPTFDLTEFYLNYPN